jgi:hypothetical protein
MLSLYYTGSDREWLGGRTKCSKVECDEIDHGYIKDGLIGFTIRLAAAAAFIPRSRRR